MPTGARWIAERYHAGQIDKLGQPYINHLARVVVILRRRWPDAGSDEIDAAWLHDVLEKTAAEAEGLLAERIPPRVVDIVEQLTHPPDLSYLRWIEVMAARRDVAVIRIKLADIEDNWTAVRSAGLAEEAELVTQRYAPATKILEAALAALDR
jgi:(p)ppGpp synthase/HD superfamily hydrolase